MCAQRGCDPGVPTRAPATAAPPAWLLLGQWLGLLSSSLCPLPCWGSPGGRASGLTRPTRLMAQVKQWLAMAAFLASMGHRDSLCERKERDQQKKIEKWPVIKEDAQELWLMEAEWGIFQKGDKTLLHWML